MKATVSSTPYCLLWVAALCAFAAPAFAQDSELARSQAVYPLPYTFTTLAGKSHALTGGNKSPRHFTPKSVAVDANGNVYFADARNHVICRISSSGDTAIIAGTFGASGSADGKGSQARFCFPRGIATDGVGNIYVADTCNNTIRRITPAGVVTTLAGMAGTVGSLDGRGSHARFNHPVSLAVDRSGNVFVADLFNCTIRKVTANGRVTTIAGQTGVPGGVDGKGANALFNFPFGVTVDDQDNVYVADTINNAIRKVTATGVVTTFAGGVSYTAGNTDGPGDTARLDHPMGLVADTAGNVYVSDTDNDTVRRITPNGVVITIAGRGGQFGSADGTGDTTRFSHPASLALDRFGNLYVVDLSNAAIRKGFAAMSTNTASAPQ